MASPSTPGAFECEAVSLRLTLGRMGQRLGWRTFLNSVKKSLKGKTNDKMRVALYLSKVNSTFLEYFANKTAYTSHLGKLVSWQILIGQLWCET